MKLLFSLTLTLISIISFGQASKDSIYFSIAFTGCFNNDLVSLSINNERVFDSVMISAIDNVHGMSNVGVYQDDTGLWLNIDKQIKQLEPVLITDTLICDILFNKKWQKYKIDLKSGENIFIDNCDFSRGVGNVLTIRQFHGTVYLD